MAELLAPRLKLSRTIDRLDSLCELANSALEGLAMVPCILALYGRNRHIQREVQEVRQDVHELVCTLPYVPVGESRITTAA